MLGQSLSPQWIAPLEAGEVFVLPNARAAAGLRARFDHHQRERGLLSWEPPAIVAWGEWMTGLWSTAVTDGAEERLLLNRVQEEALWAEILEAAAEKGIIPSGTVAGAARLARSGFALAGAHLALDRLRRSADSFDARTFAGWAERFLALCRERRMLPAALLEAAIADHLRSGASRIAFPIHMLGHDALTPSQAALVAAVRASGVSVGTLTWPAEDNVGAIRLAVTAADPGEELRFATRWMRDFFSSPGAKSRTVALILPDPQAENPQLERVLRELLAPELEPADVDLSSTPWQFSRERSLGTVPVVAAALQLLRWIESPLPLERVGQLLLSPFLRYGDDHESLARFEIDALRGAAALKPELTLTDVLATRRTTAGTDVRLPELAAFRSFVTDRNFASSSLGFADWTERVRGALRAAGWPGTRTLSAAEFRATEAWETLLDRLATLDVHGRRVGFSTLLATLEHEIQSSPAPGRTGHTPVQILTFSEAEGCAFDAALLMRSTDGNLPGPERPHPLLGRGLQRELKLPGTSAPHAAERARNALGSLLRRTGTVLLTVAAGDGSGSLRMTPLAQELGFVRKTAAELLEPEHGAEILQECEIPDADPVPALTSLALRGGARVLELQAACGFRAFASIRLGAAEPEGRSLGLDPRESGNVLHRALEVFWREVGSHARLKAMSEPDRRDQLRRAVTEALDRYRPAEHDRWGAAYFDVLESRFVRLLEDWLVFELEREPFHVLPPEQKGTVKVGPLELSIRPDRIDLVGDGRVLVDYKSSSQLSTNDWLGERPDAPQLPLYVLATEAETVHGLAFARLRRGKTMGWVGLADRPKLFSPKGRSAKVTLAVQIELWRVELERLAEEFAEGRAEVDPKHHPQTCQYCAHRPLCRLDAETLLAQDGAEPAQAEGTEIDG